MGGTRWSDDDYKDRVVYRAAVNAPTFAYDAAVRSGKVSKAAHKSLDPYGVKVREARDSDTHPESLAIVVLFDVTGSMSLVPRIMQDKLPKLMGMLLRKGYVDHPAIMVGGIGDATCDTVPLQVGQFESGIEIENDLTNIYLESGGGGQKTESYELAMYFIARHTAIDCLEKRGRRGYFFIIGDEMPYDSAHVNLVKKVVGDDIAEPVAVEDIVRELQEKYDTYFILPKQTTYYDDKEVNGKWAELLGQNLLKLEDPLSICELIASTIGLAEGKVDLDGIGKDLDDVGSSSSKGVVSKALANVSATKGDLVEVPDSGAGTGIASL